MPIYKVEIVLDEVEDGLVNAKAAEAGSTAQDVLTELVQQVVKAQYLNKLVGEALNAELAKVRPAQALMRLKSFSVG